MLKKVIKKVIKRIAAFCIVCLLLAVVCLWAVNTGSLNVSGKQLFNGLFVAYDDAVAAVYYLRFPRIVISILAGAALSVSGVLFQAVLKNPLTDPGIIGITGGAGFAAMIFTACLPGLLQLVPAAAFVGGFLAFLFVYSLSFKQGLSPLRIVLVGVAVSTMFSGLTNAFNTMTGGNLSGTASIVNGNITMKTWDDVKIALCYIPIGLLLSLLFAGRCNLLALDDRAARGIGINVMAYRFMISTVAVMLAAVSTAVVGMISFVGLIVPHIARIYVGNNHKILLPFSMLSGALIFLFADTLGRTLMPPYEVSASVIMAVLGGPFFILLLRRRSGYGS